MKWIIKFAAIVWWGFLASVMMLNAGAPVPGWELQKSGVLVHLRAVAAVSKEVCWASGGNATFLRTLDGGRVWVAGTLPCSFKLEYRSLYAWDERRALAVSANSCARIYKTSDGGVSWKIVYSRNHPQMFFDSVVFLDDKKGFIFSDPVDGRHFLLITHDGGETWKQMNPRPFPPPAPGESAFAASGSMMAVYGDKRVWFATGGKKARVYRTFNGGDAWFRSETPLLQGEFSQGIFSIAFWNEQNGVIVGGDYKNTDWVSNNAAYTVDGGRTWQLSDKGFPSGFREAAAYVPGYEGKLIVTVGPSGCDYSIDGGRSWTRYSDLGFHSLAFVRGEAAGWAVGADGVIARFTLPEEKK